MVDDSDDYHDDDENDDDDKRNKDEQKKKKKKTNTSRNEIEIENSLIALFCKTKEHFISMRFLNMLNRITTSTKPNQTKLNTNDNQTGAVFLVSHTYIRN